MPGERIQNELNADPESNEYESQTFLEDRRKKKTPLTLNHVKPNAQT